jgi:hypothetical protein
MSSLKAANFDYLGQITRLTNNRQGLTLSFSHAPAMVPPSRCKIFEADRPNPWVLLRRGDGGRACGVYVFQSRCRCLLSRFYAKYCKAKR